MALTGVPTAGTATSNTIQKVRISVVSGIGLSLDWNPTALFKFLAWFCIMYRIPVKVSMAQDWERTAFVLLLTFNNYAEVSRYAEIAFRWCILSASLYVRRFCLLVDLQTE